MRNGLPNDPIMLQLHSMKRRIHSSLHSRHVHCDLEELLQVKAKMISIGKAASPDEEWSTPQRPLTHKEGRSVSLAPSRLHSPPHFLHLIGYSTPKVAPALRLKATTIISNKPFSLQGGQRFSKKVLQKFNKFGESDGKICRSCEDKLMYRPKLFKRRK